MVENNSNPPFTVDFFQIPMASTHLIIITSHFIYTHNKQPISFLFNAFQIWNISFFYFVIPSHLFKSQLSIYSCVLSYVYFHLLRFVGLFSFLHFSSLSLSFPFFVFIFIFFRAWCTHNSNINEKILILRLSWHGSFSFSLSLLPCIYTFFIDNRFFFNNISRDDGEEDEKM